MLGAFGAAAQDTREQESRKARLEREIQVIDAQLKDNAKKSSSALTNLNLLQTKIASRRALLQESDKKISAIRGSISSKEKEVKAIQERLDTLTLYYSKLVSSAYKNRDSKVWYMYILGSENLSQAFRRVGYMKGLSGKMNAQAERISETKAQLQEEMARLEVLKAEAQEERAQRASEVASLQKEETEANGLVKQLNKEKRQYQNDLAKKRKQVEALNKEIERIIREATMAQKASSGAKSSSKTSSAKPKTEIDQALDKEFSSNKGKLPWPVDGPVVDHFGQRYHPVYKNVKLPDSKGVSIAVSPGTQVRAVFDGEVKRIIVVPGYNQCILVQHGGYFSFYCKLKSVNVKAGDKVKTGQVLGTVDTIDSETQLHFQIWKETTPQNPETWLRP